MNLVTEHVGPAPEPVVVWKRLNWSHGSDSNILKEDSNTMNVGLMVCHMAHIIQATNIMNGAYHVIM
jgi:hypothetical protein